MVNYDDTGRPIYFAIDSEDREPPVRPSALPSREIQNMIVKRGRRPGWGAERVHEWVVGLERGYEVSLAAVRYLIAMDRAKEDQSS